MESFLAALPSNLRSAVERSLDHPDGREILEQQARPYFDQGQWPSSRWTAEMVALGYLRKIKAVAEPALANQIEKLLSNRESLSSGQGALAPVLAGAGTAAATGAGAAGLKMFTDKQLQKQWAAHIDLADVLRGDIKSATAKVIRGVAGEANWDLLGKMATSVGFDPETWESEVGERLGDGLMSNLAGIFGRAAWSGQRDALDSLPEGTRLSDFQSATDEWVKEYTARLVQGQKALSERTARESIHRYLENGLPQDTITRRLMQVFPLSPRQSMAVDNYRRGLAKQDKPKGMIARFSNRYAKQLLDQKEDLIARTEANASLNFGRQIMFEKAVQNGTLPTDTRKQWITAGDEWVCPHCRPMDEEDVSLNQGFDTSLGSVLVPPLHPRCRCLIIPVAQSLTRAA